MVLSLLFNVFLHLIQYLREHKQYHYPKSILTKPIDWSKDISVKKCIKSTQRIAFLLLDHKAEINLLFSLTQRACFLLFLQSNKSIPMLWNVTFFCILFFFCGFCYKISKLMFSLAVDSVAARNCGTFF